MNDLAVILITQLSQLKSCDQIQLGERDHVTVYYNDLADEMQKQAEAKFEFITSS